MPDTDKDKEKDKDKPPKPGPVDPPGPLRAPRHRDHLFHAIVITHSTAS